MATLKEKICYALGDAAAGGITWKVMSIAFPFFFTNIYGLTLADTAALMLIARMFDVVTDPLMGSLADRTQSRWGTYRPWLIFGGPLLGIIFALLLYTPDLGPVGKRIWAYGFYLLMMAVYTAVNVPYGSLLGVMTDDDNEKNEFSSYRMVGAYAMGFVTLLSFPYLQKFIGGTEAHQYAVIGAGLGFVAAVMTVACGFMTKERIKTVPSQTNIKKLLLIFGGVLLAGIVIGLLVYFLGIYSMIVILPAAIYGLVKFYKYNTPWFYLTFVGICTNFFNGFRYAAAAYMFTYCVTGEVTFMGLIVNYTVFMTFGEVVCMIAGGLSPKFTQWAGSKKKAFIYSGLICLVTSIAFFFVPMDAKYIAVMIGIVIVTSIGIGIYSPLLWSMYADVADYATEKNGTSSTGLIFSSGTMSQKFGSAVSGALITLFLGWVGLHTPEGASEPVITAGCEDAVRTMVWSLFSLIPAGVAAIMLFLVFKYPIKK